jgi:hypothetical protein
MGLGAAYGKFKCWQAALEQCQEVVGRKRALVRLVSALNCTIPFQLDHISNLI